MYVKTEVYKYIKEKKNRILVGYKSCKVFDQINVKPRHNCSGFGHGAIICRNSTVCLYCLL